MSAADPTSEREKRWREYLREIECGNAQSLALLYDDSISTLYGLALRILGDSADAEEVLMEVFEQVWRNARAFDSSRGSVQRWLTLLTRSRAIDRLRSAAARRQREEPVNLEQREITSRDPLPDQTSIFRQQQVFVRQALNALPAEQRQVLELAYFSELTHAEIASTLSVPLGTIKTRIRMGMEKLRNALTHSSSTSAWSTQ
jgi:RNA polymerase sigma-70 factor (ECF subfamily)